MSVATRTITYEHEATRMTGVLAAPEGKGPRPGVLVFPEAVGLGRHAISSARRLAEAGYAALACDYYGDGFAGSLAEIRPSLTQLRTDGRLALGRAAAALEALKAQPEADDELHAAVGYCFGGVLALELVRNGTPLVAAVGFHSGLQPLTQPLRLASARVLVCLGADDPTTPVEQRNAFEAEMKTAGCVWQMNLYGGARHSFTNVEADQLGIPDIAAYEPLADARSWAEMLSWLGTAFDAMRS